MAVTSTPGPNPALARLAVADIARLPTRFGEFRIVSFTPAADGKEHVALVRGDVRGARDVSVRVHSECLTGDAFGSLRCDCRDQLEASLREIARHERGVVLYLRQEGRGIGLGNKVRAYALQDRGYDTIEANEVLGFRADERDYAVAADMLEALGVESVRLMSNNPQKAVDLAVRGVRITGRIPIQARPNRHNRFYLETKRAKAGHLLDAFSEWTLPVSRRHRGLSGAIRPGAPSSVPAETTP